MSHDVAVPESKALSTMGMDKQIVVTPDQLDLVKRTVFKGCTDDELKFYIYTCQRKGVHPLDKMIHPVARTGADGSRVVSFQAGIDFMRSDAESTGEYDGQDAPEFEFDDPQNPDWPTKATVKIYRKGMTRPFIGEARWKEFYPGEKMGFQWRKMPCVMLAKCAEAQALRKAFPKKLADLYTPEEMAQADVPAGQGKADRSASVKPAAQQQQSTGSKQSQAEVLSLDEEITQVLAEITGGDFAEMDKVLKSASHYEDKGKVFSFGMDRLATVSANWKNKVLAKLKGMRDEKLSQGEMFDREPGMEG